MSVIIPWRVAPATPLFYNRYSNALVFLAMHNLKQHIAGLLIATVSLSVMVKPVLAEERGQGYLPQFRLSLDQPAKQTLLQQNYAEHRDILSPRLDNFDPSADPYARRHGLQQYDARLFYPVSGIHGMSLDLGVNIKYLDAVRHYPQGSGLEYIHNFNQAIPMIYATALFELPFEGLSASLEGSHRNSERAHAFDYKAKLQYKWDRSLGLEGGWQHQQYSLDNGQQQPGLEYESKGIYLDLFMDF